MTTQAINSPNNRRPFLTFILGGQMYALPIEHVVEVVAMVELATLPDAAPELLGMANRHGTVIPVLDLRLIFGQPALPISSSTLFIVAEVGTAQAGLVVDEVLQVDYFDAAQLARTPSSNGLVLAVIPDEDQLVQIVNLTAVLAARLPGLQDVKQLEL